MSSSAQEQPDTALVGSGAREHPVGDVGLFEVDFRREHECVRVRDRHSLSPRATRRNGHHVADTELRGAPEPRRRRPPGTRGLRLDEQSSSP